MYKKNTANLFSRETLSHNPVQSFRFQKALHKYRNVYISMKETYLIAETNVSASKSNFWSVFWP